MPFREFRTEPEINETAAQAMCIFVRITLAQSCHGESARCAVCLQDHRELFVGGGLAPQI
jgi:hypothetical protein